MPAPIKHTCPAIDKQKKKTSDQRGQLIDFLANPTTYSFDDIVQLIQITADSMDEANDFLEDIRDSNDTLRSWGEGLEKELDEAQSAIHDMQSELSER